MAIWALACCEAALTRALSVANCSLDTYLYPSWILRGSHSTGMSSSKRSGRGFGLGVLAGGLTADSSPLFAATAMLPLPFFGMVPVFFGASGLAGVDVTSGGLSWLSVFVAPSTAMEEEEEFSVRLLSPRFSGSPWRLCCWCSSRLFLSSSSCSILSSQDWSPTTPVPEAC